MDPVTPQVAIKDMLGDLKPRDSRHDVGQASRNETIPASFQPQSADHSPAYVRWWCHMAAFKTIIQDLRQPGDLVKKSALQRAQDHLSAMERLSSQLILVKGKETPNLLQVSVQDLFPSITES